MDTLHCTRKNDAQSTRRNPRDKKCLFRKASSSRGQPYPECARVSTSDFCQSHSQQHSLNNALRFLISVAFYRWILYIMQWSSCAWRFFLAETISRGLRLLRNLARVSRPVTSDAPSPTCCSELSQLPRPCLRLVCLWIAEAGGVPGLKPSLHQQGPSIVCRKHAGLKAGQSLLITAPGTFCVSTLASGAAAWGDQLGEDPCELGESEHNRGRVFRALPRPRHSAARFEVSPAHRWWNPGSSSD